MPDAIPTLSIGEVAERTGLSVHALRFYEREGILATPIHRGADSRRRYSEADLDWLGICVKLRASGMPIHAMRRYAELVREGNGSELERLALLKAHQERIEGQMAELSECLDVIERKIKVYEKHHGLTSGQ